MMETGRICVKTAGRDSGKKCVIVDVLDDRNVMIDGETRRRKCNMRHLEPTQDTIKIAKGASHSDVAAEFKNLGIELKETKPRKAKPRPKQTRAAERKKMKPKAEPKKAVKAEAKATGEKKQEGAKPAAEKPEEKEATKLEKAIGEE
jgi:large subunit ribosomal protein L14e